MIDDISYMIDSMGKEIKVNQATVKALVTNPTINEFESKYIHTIEPIQQGSIVEIDTKKYISIFENVALRHDKYKTKAEHCNHEISLGNVENEWILLVDDDGKPILDIYGEEQYYEADDSPLLVPAIVRQFQGVNISGSQLLVSSYKILITVQNNKTNINYFKLNKEINIIGRWKVINVDLTQDGLINLICENK